MLQATGATPNHLRPQFTSEKVSRLRVKIEKVMKDLPVELRDLVMCHQDRGVSFWLEAILLEESDFILSKEVFKGGLIQGMIFLSLTSLLVLFVAIGSLWNTF